jgi:hypothetical protein
MVSFNFFQSAGLVGFPSIATRTLPVIASRLKTATTANIPVKPLRMAIDQGTQQG